VLPAGRCTGRPWRAVTLRRCAHARQLASTARAVSRAFDQALTAAGGSLPTWLVLLTLQTQQVANQRELAAGVGIQGATLTHHLNTMETTGLLTRRREPANRRVHLVELTERGEAAFHRMRKAAAGFDQQLQGRTGRRRDRNPVAAARSTARQCVYGQQPAGRTGRPRKL